MHAQYRESALRGFLWLSSGVNDLSSIDSMITTIIANLIIFGLLSIGIYCWWDDQLNLPIQKYFEYGFLSLTPTIGKLLTCATSLMIQAKVEIVTVQSYLAIVIRSSFAMRIPCPSACVEAKDVN